MRVELCAFLMLCKVDVDKTEKVGDKFIKCVDKIAKSIDHSRKLGDKIRTC